MRRTAVRFSLVALLVAAAGVALLVPAGCKKEKGATAAGGGNGGGGDIVIGHYASMTGTEANFGISTDNGIKLAVKERNAAGGVKGRRIKLITYDDAGKTQEVVTSVTRLIQQDKVIALIGEVASSRSIAGGEIAQRFGVPMITPSSTNESVTEIGDMISRVCFVDGFQGFVCASFAKNKLGLGRGAVLFNRSQAYSTGLKDEFIKHFKQLGGQIVAEQAYQDGDNDFSAPLTGIRQANPQFIFVPGYYTEVVNIARQARQRDIKVPLIGGDGWVSEELKNAGDALDGCYFSDHYSHEDPRPEVQAFLKKYQADFGKVPDSMAALGYDAANLLFAAVERSPSLKGPDLAKTIADTKDFNGVTGTISLDEKRNATKRSVIQRIQGGKFSMFATVDPPR
jgi:branched-chain amino acid transport system substrate-binding protein